MSAHAIGVAAMSRYAGPATIRDEDSLPLGEGELRVRRSPTDTERWGGVLETELDLDRGARIEVEIETGEQASAIVNSGGPDYSVWGVGDPPF